MLVANETTTTALSALINFIIYNYFVESWTTCILWHKDIEFQLVNQIENNYVAFVHIWRENLKESLAKDVYNFTAKEESFIENSFMYDDLIEKLTVAIEHTHCETFIAFQEDIPSFLNAFYIASSYSIWRTLRVKFLLIYFHNDFSIDEYLDLPVVMEQPNIVFVDAADPYANIFNLKTTKFIGTRFKNSEELILIDRFDASMDKFDNIQTLYTSRLKNLNGREVIMGVVDYPPFGVLKYDLPANAVDHNEDNPLKAVFVDGCEVRLIQVFCAIYNCTTHVDTTANDSWGVLFGNLTSNGMLAQLVKHKVDIATGAMYHWYNEYKYFELSNFFGFSGVTCMVPRPEPLVSWNLALKPFQIQLWFGIIICLIIETIALMTTRNLSWLFEKSQTNWLDSFKFGYTTSLKLFISQSSTTIETVNAVRIILFSCYMIDIIITSIYGGGLASILTLPIMDEAPDSVARLYKYQLKWTGQGDAWKQSLINVVDDPILIGVRELYYALTEEEMTEKAKTEYMGFVVEELMYGNIGNIEFLTAESLERLKLMVDFIFFEYTTSFTQRLWPLLAILNQFILDWHSSGFDKFWEWKTAVEFLSGNKQQRILQSRNLDADIGPVKLAIDHFAGLLLIWTVGLSLSLIVFALELFYYKLIADKERQLLAIEEF